jgi:MFS family permease
MSAADMDAKMSASIPRRRIVVASMVGTTVEFYDFYIYATAAVAVFPHLFFPKGNHTAALLASFATFGLAFVARPVGSILFGHFGDRKGRKATLIGSLLTMGIATFVADSRWRSKTTICLRCNGFQRRSFDPRKSGRAAASDAMLRAGIHTASLLILCISF